MLLSPSDALCTPLWREQGAVAGGSAPTHAKIFGTSSYNTIPRGAIISDQERVHARERARTDQYVRDIVYGSNRS
eukprot:SAG31_NODE_262_length_18842_cov_22.033346_9_plen_75_part_00